MPATTSSSFCSRTSSRWRQRIRCWREQIHRVLILHTGSTPKTLITIGPTKPRQAGSVFAIQDQRGYASLPSSAASRSQIPPTSCPRSHSHRSRSAMTSRHLCVKLLVRPALPSTTAWQISRPRTGRGRWTRRSPATSAVVLGSHLDQNYTLLYNSKTFKSFKKQGKYQKIGGKSVSAHCGRFRDVDSGLQR